MLLGSAEASAPLTTACWLLKVLLRSLTACCVTTIPTLLLAVSDRSADSLPEIPDHPGGSLPGVSDHWEARPWSSVG